MVRLAGFAAVNDEQARRPAEPVGETVEAQESRLANQYQRALLHEQKGEARAAEADLRQLLYDEPAVKASGSSAFLRQLRHLVLRNLGGLLVQSDDTAEEALRMYVEALEVDPDDVVLWHRAGTLAAELGLWGVARLLFEYGLRRCPQHSLMLEKLADALAAAHDWPAAHDSISQLKKTGVLSKRAQQLLYKLSEQDSLHHAAQTDVDSSGYLAGSFKRRRVEHATFDSKKLIAAAELVLPGNDWAQLLSCLTRQLQAHLAGSQTTSYRFQLLTQPDVLATAQAVSPSKQLEPSEAARLTGEPAGSMRPRSAGSLPLGCEEDPMQRGAETGSQDCAERISKRIAGRRCGDGSEQIQPVNDLLSSLKPYLGPCAPGQAPAVSPDIEGNDKPLVAPKRDQAALQLTIECACGDLQSLCASIMQLCCDNAVCSNPSLAVQLMQLGDLLQGRHLSPAMLLTLAELQLDAEPIPSQQQASSASFIKCSGGLQACADWLALVQEAILLNPGTSSDDAEDPEAASVSQRIMLNIHATQQQDSQEITHQELAKLAVRFSWASARLADFRKDYETSTLHYNNALIALEVLQCDAVQAAELPGDELAQVAVALPHCQHDAIISSSTALAKLQVLQLQEINQEALAHLEAGHAHSALDMLQQELLQDPDLADKASQHNPAQFCASLELLLRAHALAESDSITHGSMLTTLMLASQQLPPAALPMADAEAATASKPPFECSSRDLQALRELHDATCRFEALPLDRQQELLQSSRISAHISSLQWQLAHLLQLYLPHASNLQPASEQAATAQETCAVAATLLSKLQSADAMADQSPHAVCGLLEILGDALGIAGSLFSSHLMFVSSCLQRADAMLCFLNSRTGTETDCQKLQGIAAQCLYFLYDVDIAHRNAAWGQSEQAPSEHLKPDTDQEAARLFRHLRLYADAHSEDAKGLQVLGKLEGAFDLILGHYGQPAEDSQAASAVQALLDDADFSTDFICGSTRAELVERLMCLTTATCVDDHCQARHRIYYWKMLLRDTLSDELDAPDLILQPVGDAVIDEITLFCRLDISHQPDSLSSWERLAVLYRDTAEAIRWEMAKAVAPEDWPRQTSLLARLAAYEARAEKAGLITRLLTANAVNQDDLANISEVLGLQYYHQLQGGPPASNQRQRTSLQDGAYAECCRRCQSAYEQAARILPDEWQFPYFIGKMQSKLGAPPEQVLHSFALACRNAKLYAGGQLEPLYRLHATRLKMLLSGVVPVSLLHRHCFQSGADHHPADAGTTSQGSDVFQLLLNDCLGALRYCLKHRPWFHKAQYRLAVALWHQQSPEAAVSELRQLFSRGRKQFTIFLWKIIDDEDPERQAYAASRMEHVAEVDSDVPEEEWGQQPVKLSGIGLEETDRKSFTAARRYAVQYLRLLHITGDVATLHAATLGLQQPQSSEANASRRWSDIARLAHGYYLVTLNQLLLKRLKSANGASPAAEGSGSQQQGMPALLNRGSPVRYPDAPSTPDHLSNAGPSSPGLVDLDAVHWDLLERAYDVAMQHIIDPEQKEDWPTMIAPVLREVETELLAHGSSNVQLPPVGEFLMWPGLYIQALQANGRMDRLDQLLSKLRRRYKAGKAVPKNIARHLTRIALALSMCLRHQLAAFNPMPCPAAPQAQPSAAVQPQKPGDVPSRASNEHADAAMPKDADVSQATNAASDAPSQPDDIAAETRPAQLTDAPSQRLSSDESDPAGSPSLLTSPEPGSQSPTKRQGAIAEDRPHAEACQQQAVGRSMAEASQGGPGKDLAAAVVSAEEEAALRWQHNVLQLMQLMRHAVAMWKLAQQLQPDHKGRKRTGAVFLLVSPLTPAGMEADVADDPAALLDVAATNLCRSYRRAEATLIAAPVQDGHVTPEDALATCEGLLKQIKKLPPSSVHLLTWKSCPT
ncbi:hypothetical protein WJX74_005538 [Apatococcus lobatus]|uniref:Uncharacterized protein n=1 Tax=Apatococcus lobatus TaxID=904363 RepID=A0AAW1S581_9CHLO